MKSKIFKFNIPRDFNLIRDQYSKVRFSHLDLNHEHQPAFFEMHLLHIESINAQKGDEFLDKYVRWSEGYKSVLQSAEQTTFKNNTAYQVFSKTDASFKDSHYKINYENSCIILDDVWCVDFQFVYETQFETIYKPILQQLLERFDILGTAEDWLAAHLGDVKQAELAYKASMSAQALQKEQPLEITPFTIPKDGKESIIIDDFNFEFIEQDCFWHTVEFSQKFYIQVKAKTAQIEHAKGKGFLEYGYNLEDGEIQLSFDCSEIYEQGVPTGAFTFEVSKTGAPHFMHFRANGIPLDFYGQVTLKAGWIGIHGLFKKSYQDQPQFKIALCKKLTTHNINWALYNFTLKEALQIEPKTVKYLWVKDWQECYFPQKVLDFINLKQLPIQSASNNFNAEKWPLNNVPEAIANLQQLTQLSICNTEISKLPEGIGELKKLERLTLFGNQLKSLPDGVFNLPKLSYLGVANNELNSITEQIDLPELQYGDVTNNQFATLPKRLATQPKLIQVKLEKNPLESLPSSFNEVKVELNIDDKRRLLNFEYQGADGKGTVPWDNAMYFARNDSDLHSKFLKAIANTVLEKYKLPLEQLALKGVCINTTEADDYGNLGHTRFGGLPDLPKHASYPKWQYKYKEDISVYHHIFIAQLNCEELAAYQDYLPRKGMLYFYLEDEESFNCKVVYHPNINDLQSAKALDPSTLIINDALEPYLPFKISLSSFVALPSFYSDDYWYKLADAPNLYNLENYDHKDNAEFSETVRDHLNKALGKKGHYQEWNNTYYPDRHHSINDYVFTQHESPQEQAALKYKGNPEDWMVLLKVDSDTNCGFSFWDAGELFFVIHKSDLAKGDFSKVYASIETS